MLEKILAEKLKVDMRITCILDVCNPGFAHQGLTINKQARADPAMQDNRLC